MHKTMKRVIALILAVVLCVSAMPFSAFAVEETQIEITSSSSDSVPTAEPEETAEPDDPFETEGETVDAYQVWPATPQRAMARAASFGTGGVLQIGYYCFTSAVGVVPTLGEYVSEMPAKTMVVGGTHMAAYCLEHQKGASSDVPYTWMDLSYTAQDTIGTILALGFRWTSSSYWTGPSDNGDKWAVTQMLVWEALNGHITLKNGVYSVDSGVDADMQKCAPYAYNATRFMEYYQSVKKRLIDYMKVPSFASKEPGKATPITLKWDGSKYSATVTDTNGVLDNFRFELSIPDVKITTNGNTLSLSTTTAIVSPKTSSPVTGIDSLAGGKGAVAVWRTSDRSQQDCATYNAGGGDPVQCYIKVKTDAVGSAGLVKTAEDGEVSGRTFQIEGSDGSSQTLTTDSSGRIDVDSLPIYTEDGEKITYTATETNVPIRYVKPASQTFQLTEGQTASIQFENRLKKWRVTVKKDDSKTELFEQSENYSSAHPQGNATLRGARYGVYQGDKLVKEYTTDENGQFITEYFPYGEDWSLKEISASEGYKVSSISTALCDIPDSSNEEYTDNAATVTEDVIRGGVSIEKRDSVTGKTPQGDASFAGIEFEVVNQSRNPVEVNGNIAAPGEVAMTITTDEKGFATTGANALPYGEYIIREIKTNTSMLKTFTKEIPVKVTEEGKIYPFTAENDVVRGGIAVEKRDTRTGETPQGNADFSGITFEIVNSSARAVVVNGVTYAPGSVVATLVTDKDGKASTSDDLLPYGRYTLREVSTNSSMLLTWPEQVVSVSKNKEINTIYAENEVVRGGISVEKRDSITGETPQGDADFEGITFEVINDSKHPVIVNDKSIAPGEVALTLTTDAEGKCSTANDALPYGSYILRESATNKSMLNTAPDQMVVISNNHEVYPFYMYNEVVRGGVLIEKRDLESLLLTPLGGAGLDGTLFEITNVSKNAVYVNGALYQPGEICATIEVEKGIAKTDTRALPYGSYTLAESKPGKGYLWTDKKVREFTVREDGEVTEYREGDAAYNQVIRGELKFKKVGEDTMHRFANVAFQLTSQTTGESHILITDQNGGATRS